MCQSAAVHTNNEHKTSQTCMYCFGPTSHPTQTIKTKDGKTKTRSIHGASLCLNPACVSVLNHRAIQGRDKTSALAILLFKQPLPVFNPKPSQSNTGIISRTISFCNRNEKRAGSGAALADA
ncbi:Transcription factor bye1 [Mucor velutinosus]|uniref:Transcription factor bye1 n=1 Tax=Mucor velutinosus TaxID=708070 RepID=A0AAN7DNL4_9FUNG|nr:Transcription factor bye1 [Mucor velutinosus]